MQIGYRPHQNRSTYFASAARGPICSAPYHSPLASAGDRASISPIAQMLMMFSGGSLLGSLVAPGQNQAPVQASPQFGRRAQSAPTTTGTGSLDQLGPSRYDNLIREAAAKYDMDPALIKAVIKKESSFNPSAGSSAGAQGLMQLMPGTFRAMGGGNPLNPRDNVFAGTRYLSKMLKQHDGNLELALAAYNAGPGNVRKHGGIPPFRETQNYVRTVMQDYRASGA